MKSDPLTSTLMGVLAATALASIVLFYCLVAKTHQARQLQPQVMAMQNNANFFNAIITDVREYSKRDPQINGALSGSAIWKNVLAASTNKPAGK